MAFPLPFPPPKQIFLPKFGAGKGKGGMFPAYVAFIAWRIDESWG